MHDQPPFNYPFHEKPTDDPVTGPAAQCSDPLQVDSRQHPSLECPLVVPEVKRSQFFTCIRAIGKATLRGTRSIVSAVTQPWSHHTHQH